MRNCTEFPPKSAFKTDMKGDCDDEIYQLDKAEFDRRKALPDADPNKWYNFTDYLRYYNGSFSLLI